MKITLAFDVYGTLVDPSGMAVHLSADLGAKATEFADYWREKQLDRVFAAPQLELLKRATLCITHAGLNTALESLGQGVPMVAIPIGYDQPGVAARVAHHGVGQFVEIEDLTVERIRRLTEEVLENPHYREKARWFQKVIARTRGLDVAADVIERAFHGNQSAERGKTSQSARVSARGEALLLSEKVR